MEKIPKKAYDILVKRFGMSRDAIKQRIKRDDLVFVNAAQEAIQDLKDQKIQAQEIKKQIYNGSTNTTPVPTI